MGRMSDLAIELEMAHAFAAIHAPELVAALEEVRDHLGASLVQVTEYDDEIIVEHMRAAYRAAADALRAIRT